MGVEGVFPFLEEMEVPSTKADMSLVRCIEVDVMSLFFSYIRSTLSWLYFSSFRRGSQQENHPIPSRILAGKIHKKLLETFTQDAETILHFDGSSTIQKSKARDYRNQRNQNSKQAFFNYSGQLDKLLDPEGDMMNQRTRKRKLLRLNSRAKKSWRDSRVIDPAFKTDLPLELKKLGWEVCCCMGEADVCIGRKANSNPGTIVAASADSDLLFYSLRALFRKDPRSHVYYEIKVADILRTLQICPSQWVVTGIVTNNDYSSHLPGRSFRKNLTAVREHNDGNPEEVLRRYCETFRVDPAHFKNSTDIFLQMKEDHLTLLSDNTEIDAVMLSLVSKIAVFFQR